ncbi:hypothetical protein ACU635_34430 [[Actinomadura] parvosata]|uniref:hypothetical protein n=1 Tax=[Actinomadura] parvosata TaxID=1955412 RepID=UPI00406C887C
MSKPTISRTRRLDDSPEPAPVDRWLGWAADHAWGAAVRLSAPHHPGWTDVGLRLTANSSFRARP